MHQWRQSMRCKKEKASTRGAREKTMSADTPIAFSLLRHRIRQPRNILFDLSAQIFDWGNSASICVSRMRQNSSFMCLWSISKWFVFLCACVVYYTAFSKCVNASFWGQCHCCVCAVFFIFTHSIAVHEKDSEWLSTLVFQTEEEGIMSIEVMCSLQGGGKTQGDRGRQRGEEGI